MLLRRHISKKTLKLIAEEAGGSTESSCASRASPADVHGFRVRAFGWNIGGASLELLPEAIRQSAGEPPEESLVLLQECPRVAPGWKTVRCDGMVVLSHRKTDQWRGCGIGLDPRTWAPVSKKVAGKGPWFAMRHLRSQETFLLGTLHITPGLSQVDYIQVAEGFLSRMPKGYRRVVVQGDFNARHGRDHSG